MLEFKHCRVNVDTATKEEIQHELNRMTQEMWDNYNLQMALKILLNSAYGVIGNQYFVCYDKDVAESITTQGRNIIVYCAKAIEKYFKTYWHQDTELHEQLGIVVNHKVEKPVIVAGDTDSLFVSLSEVLESTDFEGDPMQLIMQLYELKLKPFFNSILEIYAKKWNCSNLHEFEMEVISGQGFWLAKKKYVLDMRWKEGGQSEYKGKVYPGQFFEEGTKRKYTGIEIKKKSTPLYGRKVIDDVINYLFKVGNNINIAEFTQMLKRYKDEFKLQDINDISLLSTANNYRKYVLDDRTELKIKKGCPLHIRGACVYNYLLNNSKLKNKYEMIKSGQKVKYYYAKGDFNEVFSFPPGAYPVELGLEFDYDKMFTKVILDPVNRFMVAMGKTKLPTSLVTMRKMW